MDTTDRVILITGASRGIGAACALRFAAPNIRLALHYYKNEEKANRVLEQVRALGADAMLFDADIADRAQVHRMLQRIEYHLGPVDVLINNAGIAQQKLFCDLTEEDWQRMIDVDLTGAFHLCREVLPSMVDRQTGCIVNLSSMWGVAGASCEAAYSAAKAGIIGLTKALAKEMGPSHIRVNCVAPGVIDTEMNANLTPETMEELKETTPLGTLGTPKQVADAIFFLCSEEASFITGQVLGVDGGFVI